MNEKTCFDIFPVPDARAECVQIAERLEARLRGLIPDVRFAAMRETLNRWDALSGDERQKFKSAMAWRHGLFLEDQWLWDRLDLPSALGPSPARSDFLAWTRLHIRPEFIQRYLKEKNKFNFPVDPLKEAERILRLDFSPLEVPGHWVHHGAVEWQPKKEGIDNEIIVRQLRFNGIEYLAFAYNQTGEERFANGAMQLLADITWEIPGNLISRVGLGGCWTHWGVDALDVAIRTWRQIVIAHLCSGSQAMNADQTTLAWKILYFCGARSYEYYHKSPHNIIFFEPSALGELGFTFPQFRDAATWREAAQRRIIGALGGGIMADGSNIEGAFGYHRTYVIVPFCLVETARLSGLPLLPEFEAVYADKRTRALEVWARVCTPSRMLPALGDCWPSDIRPDLARYGEMFGSALALGVAALDCPSAWPKETSCYLPVQRYAVMRSGWDPEAIWCGFNLRPFTSHCHRDTFHVELQAGDQRLLLDSGCIDYCANRPRSQATQAHNTLVVDQANQLPGGAMDIRWHTSEWFDWIEGMMLPDPGILHRRAVCFLKPDYFIVLDRVEAVGEAVERRFDFYYHLPAEHPVLQEGMRVETAAEKTWNIGMDFLADGPWELRREQGFLATGYLLWQEAPVAVLGARFKPPFTVVAIIRPYRPGVAVARNWTLERQPLILSNAADGEPIPSGQGVGVTVGCEGGAKDTVIWCATGYGEKRANSWQTDGELLVARTAMNGKSRVAARNASVVYRNGTPVPWTLSVNQADISQA